MFIIYHTKAGNNSLKRLGGTTMILLVAYECIGKLSI